MGDKGVAKKEKEGINEDYLLIYKVHAAESLFTRRADSGFTGV